MIPKPKVGLLVWSSAWIPRTLLLHIAQKNKIRCKSRQIHSIAHIFCPLGGGCLWKGAGGDDGHNMVGEACIVVIRIRREMWKEDGAERKTHLPGLGQFRRR
ncbi:hypothetical protein B0H14DRAFT_2559011 [Mycena olivaceomarginata]|nr:hypothetical protein B0H14DRAFT_2559011 [Mycena olivaceomarginata]